MRLVPCRVKCHTFSPHGCGRIGGDREVPIEARRDSAAPFYTVKAPAGGAPTITITINPPQRQQVTANIFACHAKNWRGRHRGASASHRVVGSSIHGPRHSRARTPRRHRWTDGRTDGRLIDEPILSRLLADKGHAENRVVMR